VETNLIVVVDPWLEHAQVEQQLTNNNVNAGGSFIEAGSRIVESLGWQSLGFVSPAEKRQENQYDQKEIHRILAVELRLTVRSR
jgi:hypothetical protein